MTKTTDTERRVLVARNWGEGKWVIINKDGVSVLQDKEVLKMVAQQCECTKHPELCTYKSLRQYVSWYVYFITILKNLSQTVSKPKSNVHHCLFFNSDLAGIEVPLNLGAWLHALVVTCLLLGDAMSFLFQTPWV